MTTRFRLTLAACAAILFLQSCSAPPASSTDLPAASPTDASTIPAAETAAATLVPAAGTESLIETATSPASTREAADTSDPEFWKDLPVVPEGISQRVREIYVRGLEMGNNPHAFSKVGDCNSTVPYFLADFDRGTSVYNLGDYEELQPTIEYFSDSFGRKSLSAKIGLSTAGVLASLWSDWKQCSSNETPLDCEYRIHRPSFAIISLGTNEAYDVKKDRTPFEPRLRRIIEHSIDQGVVPILSTKADNDEGEHYINYTTARLAVEYELPFWNYWRAVQPLPQHGMRSSDHLTFAPTYSFADFSNPDYLNYGMQIRNLTALQALDVIRREIEGITELANATPTPAPTSFADGTHQAGDMLVSPVDGMTLIYIPAGTFEMGSEDGNPDQSPVHTVSLDAYWMDATEVTNAMFAKFLNASGNQTEGGVTWLDAQDPSVFIVNVDGVWQAREEFAKYPTVGVSWYGADAYCTWAGRNLPTEAQWEFAARGNTGFRFPWGDSDLSCDHARYAGCGNNPVQTASLTLGLSPFGLYEMAGNVAEWVSDRYAADYYSQSPALDPMGPSNGYYRVFRGGYFGSSYIALQPFHRDWAGADTRESFIGFRCGITP
jgi:formylglycine-generating enzyme required for sulfatase activity